MKILTACVLKKHDDCLPGAVPTEVDYPCLPGTVDMSAEELLLGIAVVESGGDGFMLQCHGQRSGRGTALIEGAAP